MRPPGTVHRSAGMQGDVDDYAAPKPPGTPLLA